MKRSMVLTLWMFAGAAANGWAQDAVWTNVVEGVVTTGSWHTAANWLPNVLPAAGQNVRLTNAVESYVVEVNEPITIYATSSSAQTLFMSAPVGKTVTLDVNDNITGSSSTVLADFVKRLTINLGARSFVNVAPDATLRYNATGTMAGTLDVSGSAYWYPPNSGDTLAKQIVIRDGGTLATATVQNQDIILGGASQVVIQEGGRWDITMRSQSDKGIIMPEVQAVSQQIMVTGTLNIAVGMMRVGHGNASTTTGGPEVHVGSGGLLNIANSSGWIAVSHPGAASGARGKFFVSGGTVTNAGPLYVAHGRGLAHRDSVSEGELHLNSGFWRNQGLVLIGGFNPASSWALSRILDGAMGWSYPPKVKGTYTQSDGTFQSLGNVYIAYGPAQSVMTLSGGQMIATNAAGTIQMSLGLPVLDTGDGPSAGWLLPGRATLNLHGGALIVDDLFGTNGVAKTSTDLEGHSVINFHAGSLFMKASTLDLGIPLTVGDGTQAATLNLLGGTHSSAFGYVIKPNATLAVGGSGTVANVAVSGDVTFEDAAKLQVELADADTADRINVTGSVVLAGELDVAGLGNYEPSGGEWTVLTSTGSITGAFSSVTEGYKAEVLGGDTLVVKSSRGGTMLLIR